jgi:hypothetical protein
MPTDTIKWIEIYYNVLDTINCQQINYWVYRGIPSLLLRPSTRDLYAPNPFMPPRSISIWPANPLPSLETRPTKWVSLV